MPVRVFESRIVVAILLIHHVVGVPVEVTAVRTICQRLRYTELVQVMFVSMLVWSFLLILFAGPLDSLLCFVLPMQK